MLDIIQTNSELIFTEEVTADRHPVTVYLATMSKSSRRPVSQALGKLAELITGIEAEDKKERAALAMSLDWAGLRFQHTALIRSELETMVTAGQCSLATANRYLSALRGILKTAWRLGYMSAEDYHRAADVPSLKGETLPKGRRITTGELNALMDACTADQRKTGIRDSAIIALFYSCGLRRSELVKFDLDDYDPATGELKIRMAKGKKDRLMHVVNGAAAALADWLTIRGDDPGPLFLAIRKGGHIKPGRMTTQAAWHIVTTRADQSGVKKLSPHDFRRSFISDLLDNGVDISTVADLAGHSDISTTKRYDHRGEATKRDALTTLHVPYKKRTL